MINTRYLHYIPVEKRDECYNSLVEDIYYFYFGIKPKPNEKIKCINGNKFDLNKNNLLLIASTGVYGGIDTNISFAVVLQITDYVDSLQNF